MIALIRKNFHYFKILLKETLVFLCSLLVNCFRFLFIFVGETIKNKFENKIQKSKTEKEVFFLQQINMKRKKSCVMENYLRVELIH